jgi:hypothetical protein
MRAKRLAAAVVAATVAAGCGGERGSGERTASVVPAAAYFYAEADLDPDGEQEKAVRSVLAALPGVGDPSQRLREQFDHFAQRRYGRRAARFDRDIEPWLGGRIAVFTAVPAKGADVDDPPTGLVVASKDEDAAKKWVFEVSRLPSERSRTYSGVRYLYTRAQGGTASGVVDGFVVTADEAAFRAAVRAAKHGGLDEQPRFARAVRKTRDDRLGVVWYDAHRLFDTLARRAGGRYLARALPALRRLVPDDPLLLTIGTGRKALTVDGAVPANKGGFLTSLFDEGTSLIDQLPKDSLAVIGQPEFGAYLEKLMALADAGAGGPGSLERELRRDGVDLDRDLLGWMGDAAIFVRRGGDRKLGGALVIQTGEVQRAYDGISRVEKALVRARVPGFEAKLPGADIAFAIRLPGLREPIYVVQGGKRVVVSYGAASARAALTMGGLGGSPRWARMRAQLGIDWAPAGYLDVAGLLRSAPRGWAGEARPYLEAVRYVVIGGREDGARLRSLAKVVFR